MSKLYTNSEGRSWCAEQNKCTVQMKSKYMLSVCPQCTVFTYLFAHILFFLLTRNHSEIHDEAQFFVRYSPDIFTNVLWTRLFVFSYRLCCVPTCGIGHLCLHPHGKSSSPVDQCAVYIYIREQPVQSRSQFWVSLLVTCCSPTYSSPFLHLLSNYPYFHFSFIQCHSCFFRISAR